MINNDDDLDDDDDDVVLRKIIEKNRKYCLRITILTGSTEKKSKI